MPKYRGHNGIHCFNSAVAIPEATNEVIRFAVMEFAPQLLSYNINATGAEKCHQITGPFYSLLKEAAFLGNKSLYFYDVQRQRYLEEALMMGYVDTVVVPTYSTLKGAFDVWQLGLSKPIPACLDVMSLDHVIYRPENPKKAFMRLVEFDLPSFFVLLLFVILLPLLSNYLVPKIPKARYYWFYLTSLFHPVLVFQKSRDKLFSGVWCLATVLIIFYYQSQMFSNLTMKEEPLLINFLEELAARSSLTVWAAVGTIKEGQLSEKEAKDLVENYFVKSSETGKRIRSRLNLFSSSKMLFGNYQDEMMRNITKGLQALLTVKSLGRYVIETFRGGHYKELLHLSKEGGDWQPMFLSILPAGSRHESLFKTTVVRLCESGIYKLWNDLISDNGREAERLPEEEYEPISVSGLFSVASIMFFMLGFASLTFAFELLRKHRSVCRKRKKRKETDKRRQSYKSALFESIDWSSKTSSEFKKSNKVKHLPPKQVSFRFSSGSYILV